MPDYVVDACVVLNLSAADLLGSVCTELEGTVCVPPQVARESLYLRGSAEDSTRTPIDLSSQLSTGVLVEHQLSSTEAVRFVDFAALVDDGEAACLAIAEESSGVVLTDDRLAIRISREHKIDVRTTPEVIHEWSSVELEREDGLPERLRRIECLASYKPPGSHPLAEWWNKIVGA